MADGAEVGLGGWHKDEGGGEDGMKAETEGSMGWGGQSASGRRAPSSDANLSSSSRDESPTPQSCFPAHKGFPKGKTKYQDGSLNTVPSSSTEVYHFSFLALHFYTRANLEQGKATSMPSPPKALGSQAAHLSHRWSEEFCKIQHCETTSCKSQVYILVMPTRQDKARDQLEPTRRSEKHPALIYSISHCNLMQ